MRGSKQAYFYVDVSKIPQEAREALVEDASMGGAQYGMRIVELIHNGPAQSPVYGVYYGEDEKKWALAQEELTFDSEEADDEVLAKASAAADAAAAAQNAADEARVSEVVEAANSKTTGKK